MVIGLMAIPLPWVVGVMVNILIVVEYN